GENPSFANRMRRSLLAVGEGRRDSRGSCNDPFVVSDESDSCSLGESDVYGVICRETTGCPLRYARKLRLSQIEAQLLECGSEIHERGLGPVPPASGDVDDLQMQKRRREDDQIACLE